MEANTPDPALKKDKVIDSVGELDHDRAIQNANYSIVYNKTGERGITIREESVDEHMKAPSKRKKKKKNGRAKAQDKTHQLDQSLEKPVSPRDSGLKDGSDQGEILDRGQVALSPTKTKRKNHRAGKKVKTAKEHAGMTSKHTIQISLVP